MRNLQNLWDSDHQKMTKRDDDTYTQMFSTNVHLTLNTTALLRSLASNSSQQATPVSGGSSVRLDASSKGLNANATAFRPGMTMSI